MIPNDESGWMARCVLIGSVRQAGHWIAALQAAAHTQNVELVFLDARPIAPMPGDRDRVFVSLDRNHLAPTSTAERIAVLDGVQIFSGLDLIPEEDARIHLIEVTRFAVEALEWGAGGTVITSKMVNRARATGEHLEMLGLSITPPDIERQGDSRLDRLAAASIAYIGPVPCETPCAWDPSVFVYDRAPLSVIEGAASLDMTGPPRPLFRGPYLWATRGRRRIAARFSVDDDAARHELQFRWGPPLFPTLHRVTPERSGVYEIVMEADWAQIDGMEFTMALVHGCVAGNIVFMGAAVSQI